MERRNRAESYRNLRSGVKKNKEFLSLDILLMENFYDFNVFTKKKLVEKLDYIHWNPVKRGLVASSEQWRWSSDRYYSLGEEGPVKIDPFI